MSYPSNIQALVHGSFPAREGDESVDRNGIVASTCSPPLSLLMVLPLLFLSQIVYTDRFESRRDHDSSSINLIRCSRFESMNMSQSISDDQGPYTLSSMPHRNHGQNYEDMDKAWLSNNPSRNNSMPLPGTAENQERRRSFLPHSDSSLLPSIHTIILDFSMVHFVDSRASVSLRQVSTEEAFTRALMPSYLCPRLPRS